MTDEIAPSFRVLGATPNPDALVPSIELAVSAEAGERQVYAVALRAEVLLDPQVGSFSAEALRRFVEIFGGAQGRIPWARVDVLVPSFRRSTRFTLAIPCGGLNTTAAKLFHAADEGAVPIFIQLSGTVFYQADTGRMQIQRLPWDRNVTFALSKDVWSTATRSEHETERWVALSPETLVALRHYVDEQGLPSPDAAVAALLAQATERAA